MNINRMSIPELPNSNCRSLFNKVDYLQFLLSQNTYRNCGVITIQESWLNDLQDDCLVSLHDFKIYRRDRSNNKKRCGGGVATFVNINWCRSSFVCFKFSNDFVDCLTLRCRPKHLNKYKCVYVTNIYVIPDCTSSALSVFADELTEFAVSAFNDSFSVVCGDFNSCDCSFLTSLGHQNVVDFPTRLDANLDVVFINDMGVYATRKRAPLSSSDHCIIRVLPKVYGKHGKSTLLHQTKKVKYRNYSEENIRNLKNMFHTTNWELFTDDSLENTTDVITCYLKFCFDICCPTETIFVTFDRLTSSQLKRLRRMKGRMYKEKNSNEVRKLNGLINLEIRRLNCMFTQKLLSCKNSPSMWKFFKELTGDRKFRSDNQLNVCDLNKSFVRQSSDVMLPLSTGLKNSCVPTFTETDVRGCLQSLNSSRCLGPDGIPNILFKKCADVLCHPFTTIFNRSFSSNLILKMWRKMKIIPVTKKAFGDKNVKCRPIAITSPFLKTMEKLLILPLQPAIKEHTDPCQFAYRRKRSTLDAVAVLHHNIVFNLEKGKKYVRCAFLDYTSAFDSIPRQRLLNKLISVNTDSWITNWLCSYLSGREQYIVFGGKSSDSLLSQEGVPQGAVLSPLLLSFFLHDLPSSTENTFVKYADDLTVCMPISSSLNPIEMNEFLSRIDCWSVGNGLILNPSKCQAVNFSMRHERKINTILRSHSACIIGDSLINSVSKINYLGVTFSADLSWYSHFLSLPKKVFRLTYYIKRLHALGITRHLLLQFVNSCILPIILYCSPLLFPGILRKDFAVLRRVLKAVSKTCGESFEVIINMVVDRHLKPCKRLAGVIL
ncbi:unnamed protein product [Schistosoma mattheei]|uniref:Reverse transcriptase domain-containing protein n=1 Tax=Schistosoma mattheei TaxID=31246 RepID=A0AA85BK76_9TREM|nr:unnamed protein product [Schistosoma mattheei]